METLQENLTAESAEQVAVQKKHSFAPVGATERKKTFWADFRQFLKQYSVIGLAIGIVMGTAVNNIVNTLVQGVITPLIGLIVPSQNLQTFMWHVRGVTFRFGDLLSAVISFIIIAFLIYGVVKLLLRNDELLNKK